MIFLASAWLVAAWILSIGWRPPVQAHAASYTPGVRGLLLAVVMGICVAWPLVRLSAAPRAWPIRQALLDVAVLLCLVQVVVWPLRLVTPWTAARSASLDLCIAGWALAATAVVALGTTPLERRQTWLRVGGMLVAVLLVGLAPMMALLSGDGLPLGREGSSLPAAPWWRSPAASPITALNALTAGGASAPSPGDWAVARTAWWVAAATWLAVLVGRLVRPSVADAAGASADGAPASVADSR